MKSLGWLLLIGGLVAFGVGAVLDERRDRSLRSLSTALVVLGLVLAVGTLLAPLPDLSGGGWVLPATLAMVGMPSMLTGGCNMVWHWSAMGYPPPRLQLSPRGYEERVGYW